MNTAAKPLIANSRNCSARIENIENIHRKLPYRLVGQTERVAELVE